MTVFIQKGDPALSIRQAENRGRDLFEAERAQWERETGILLGTQDYLEWANQWLNDNLVNTENNIFNNRLAAYRAAVERLGRYRLAAGQEEVAEDRPTGDVDPQGNPIVERVVLLPEIEPLPSEIEVPTFDELTGEQTGYETIPNPPVAADEAERAAAQAVVDATPQDVKDFQ